MIESMSWIFVIIAIYGTYLNAHMRRQGFYYWLVSNTAFCVINLGEGHLAQAFLFAVYLILAIIGLQNWKN